MSNSAFTVTGVNGITSVATGTGLSGGTITSTGTINLALTGLNGYRLTLTTNVPVTTTDVTAATTLYCTPYKGIDIALYSGSAWLMFQPGQLSIAVPATTNHNYDVFMDYNGGTPQLALLVWTNQTTRATALAYQNGVYVLSGTATKRYLGTFATTGSSGKTEDSVLNRLVWNYYNRISKPIAVNEGANTNWVYSTTAWRQSNANTANQFQVIAGLIEDTVNINAISQYNNNTNSGGATGIGINSTTVPASNVLQLPWLSTSSGICLVAAAAYTSFPTTIGLSSYKWLECAGPSGGTQTWYGNTDLLGIGPTGFANSGMYGAVLC